MFHNKMIHGLNLDLYTDLIPDIYYSGITGGTLNAVAVYDGDPKDQIIVGVIVTQALGKWMELVWVKMTEPYSAEVITADFIRYHISSARRSGFYEGVFAEIPETEETKHLLDVFMLAQMETRKQRGNVCSFCLKDVSAKVLLKSVKLSVCKSLAEADDNEKDRIQDIIHRDSHPVPLPYGLRWTDYHQEFSAIAFQDKEPTGLLLVEEKEGKIILDLAYTANPKALPALLGNTLKKMLDTCSEDTEILVPSVVKKTDEIVDRLVKDVKRQDVIQAVTWFQRRELPNYARMVMEDVKGERT